MLRILELDDKITLERQQVKFNIAWLMKKQANKYERGVLTWIM